METSILIEGFGKSFALDLRLSSLDLQLTAIQSVLSILEHSIRVTSRAEDQKLLRLQVEEVEDLRQRLFTDSIQVTLTESEEEHQALDKNIFEDLAAMAAEIEDLEEMAVTKVNAMKGLVPELPGVMPDMAIEDEAICSSASSPDSQSPDFEAVPTNDTGNRSPRKVRRHTWGLPMPSQLQKEVCGLARWYPRSQVFIPCGNERQISNLEMTGTQVVGLPAEQGCYGSTRLP
ncbi:unnamed protein product [Cladocopium goreaui]|uniref:Uncharacterized protein n=1 Tax=Cladocopium goreaui TaxID=2562237 RepID=A0A9P1CTX0_9DINO|nr:unnamed protein product [Cladocopium goreaui]